MLVRHLSSIALATAFLVPATFIACSDDDGPGDHDHEAGVTGGASNTGGKASTGGKANSGGTSGAGGGPTTGGSSGSGGVEGGVPDAGDAGPISVTLNFKAKVGTQDFACGTSYPGVGTTNAVVSPVDFRLFVQDLNLIDAAGGRVPVTLDVTAPWQNAKVAFLDFENGTAGCAANGTTATNKVIKGTVPAGNYTGVSFSNGVPEEWNHADPATLPEPLQAGASMTWGWLLGFRFAVIEFNGQPGNDAGDVLTWLHVGSTACANTPLPDGGTDFGKPPNTACAKQNRSAITLTGFNPETNSIVIDAAEIFDEVDVTQPDNGCHSFGTACPSLFENVGLNFATGAALATHPAYRVE